MDIKKIKLDDFVGKVNDHTAEPQQKVAISGYVGKSPNASHVRIYKDLSLGHYAEVHANDVIHQEPLPQNSNHIGGSVMWLKKDAKISTGNNSFHYDAQNNYFKGDIANGLAHGVTKSNPTGLCTDNMAVPGPITVSRPTGMCTDYMAAVPGTITKSSPTGLCTDYMAMGAPTKSSPTGLCTDYMAMGTPTKSSPTGLCTDYMAMGTPTKTGPTGQCTDFYAMGAPTKSAPTGQCTDYSA
ncbi:MAG: hypothetical protein IPP71_07800 [Bacteroidetes bacterium]|nr:hypothetical protein [Bacteroidota bacterium]